MGKRAPDAEGTGASAIAGAAALRAEEELHRESERGELEFYRESLEMLLEEFELKDNRAVFFTPSRISGEPALLISHGRAEPPADPGVAAKRLIVESGKSLYLRLPSLLRALGIGEIGRASTVAEAEGALSSILGELGLVAGVRLAERRDGILVLEVGTRRGSRAEGEPGSALANLAGSVLAESLDRVVQLLRVEEAEGRYVFYFRAL